MAALLAEIGGKRLRNGLRHLAISLCSQGTQ